MSPKSGVPQRRFLVYTSAGDRDAVSLWLEGRRNFDLWVTYYGDHPERHRELADFWEKRRAGKFQNLHSAWLENAELFAHYDAVLVLDDDIIIDADGISRLFELREKHDLTLLQPAFLNFGKVSHKVTRRRASLDLHFVDFIENNCPLFRRDALETFLNEFDGGLTGWGIDYWFLHVLRKQPDYRAAVIDSVPCVNPREAQKAGVREIRRLQPDQDRRDDWRRVRERLGIDEVQSHRDLGGIPCSAFQRFIQAPWMSLLRRWQLWTVRRRAKP